MTLGVAESLLRDKIYPKPRNLITKEEILKVSSEPF